MKTKIGSTKKLLVASVALLASLGVAAGSTFAWFTTSSSVEVSQYETQVVSASDSLTFAVAAYDTEITASAVQAASATAGVTGVSAFSNTLNTSTINNFVTPTAKLTALTSTDGVNLYSKSEAAKLGTADASSATASTPNSDTGSYISFKLILRNYATVDGADSTGRTIFLDAGSEVAAPADAGKTVEYSSALTTIAEHLSDNFYGANPIITEATDSSPATLTAYAAHAARVSFTDGLAATDNQTYAWAPNEHNATGAQETSATTTTNGKGYWRNNLANDYWNNYYTDNATTTQAAIAATNTTAITAGAAHATTNQITPTWSTLSITGSQYVYAVLTVNIWIEGTDGDCFDAILDDKFTTTLALSVGAAVTGS